MEPPTTDVGLSARLLSQGVRVRVLVRVSPARLALMVTPVPAATAPASMTACADFAPAPMVMLLEEEPLLSKTARLPLLVLRLMPTLKGTAALSVTVRVAFCEPTTVAGRSVIDS